MHCRVVASFCWMRFVSYVWFKVPQAGGKNTELAGRMDIELSLRGVPRAPPNRALAAALAAPDGSLARRASIATLRAVTLGACHAERARVRPPEAHANVGVP